MIAPLLLIIVIFAGPVPDRMNLTAVVMLTSIGLAIGIYFNWVVRATLAAWGLSGRVLIGFAGL